MALYPEYQRLMDSGEYESVNEMCNDLGLNYDEVFDYSEYEDHDDDEDDGSTNRRRRSRR